MSNITFDEVKTAIKVMEKLSNVNEDRIVKIMIDGIINILKEVLEEEKK